MQIIKNSELNVEINANLGNCIYSCLSADKGKINDFDLSQRKKLGSHRITNERLSFNQLQAIKSEQFQLYSDDLIRNYACSSIKTRWACSSNSLNDK